MNDYDKIGELVGGKYARVVEHGTKVYVHVGFLAGKAVKISVGHNFPEDFRKLDSTLIIGAMSRSEAETLERQICLKCEIYSQHMSQVWGTVNRGFMRAMDFGGGDIESIITAPASYDEISAGLFRAAALRYLEDRVSESELWKYDVIDGRKHIVYAKKIENHSFIYRVVRLIRGS